jgi:circadian clock protein KaiC
VDQIATRRLRFVKYRGSVHGTDEYPFLIDETGFSILPVTSLGLDHEVTSERVSTGIPRLDGMLGGQGYYRGSSVLISGSAGTGKTSLAAYFADATCRRGERCLYLAFEESQNQIIRNMRSIGLDLEPWVKQGLLKFHAARSTLYGLEMHLAMIHKLTNDFQPWHRNHGPHYQPVHCGQPQRSEVGAHAPGGFFQEPANHRLFTNLTHPGELETTTSGVSSLMDTWLLLLSVESSGERNRVFHILKSRGMAHSNQMREFIITDQGIDLVDVYLGPGGVFTGAARLQQEAQEKAAALAAQEELEHRRRVLDRKRQIMEAQVAALQAEISAEEEELQALQEKSKLQQKPPPRIGRGWPVARKADAPEFNEGE